MRHTALVASLFAVMSGYAGFQQYQAHLLLKHRSSESYSAAIVKLDDANKALEYLPEQDRDIQFMGETVPFGTQEKLPDLPRARTSIEDALVAVPEKEKPALQQLALNLAEPGLHQEEKKTIEQLHRDYTRKQSESDITTYKLQQARENNGTAALLFGCAACLVGLVYFRSRKK